MTTDTQFIESLYSNWLGLHSSIQELSVARFQEHGVFEGRKPALASCLATAGGSSCKAI